VNGAKIRRVWDDFGDWGRPFRVVAQNKVRPGPPAGRVLDPAAWSPARFPSSEIPAFAYESAASAQ
jgi:hypothetical protein